jgi:hypothetical protein
MKQQVFDLRAIEQKVVALEKGLNAVEDGAGPESQFD